MKRLAFIYRVTATIQVSKEHLSQIMAVASQHYDGKCQSFGETRVKYWRDWGSDVEGTRDVTITVDFNEIDTVCKILECQHYVPGVNLHNCWSKLAKEMGDECERINAPTMMKDDSYTESYREDLRRKYGENYSAVIPKPAAS